MAIKGNTGFKRIYNAFFFSMKGFKATYHNEESFRQEVFLSIFLIPAAFWLGETGFEKALLICVLLLVLIVELLNTGIEVVVDRFGGEHHELSGMAKDIGSAAVLMSLINVVIVWSLILLY